MENNLVQEAFDLLKTLDRRAVLSRKFPAFKKAMSCLLNSGMVEVFTPAPQEPSPEAPENVKEPWVAPEIKTLGSEAPEAMHGQLGVEQPEVDELPEQAPTEFDVEDPYTK